MQTIQRQTMVRLETCPADLMGRTRPVPTLADKAALRRAVAEAAAALEKRHPDWYNSLFDLSLFEHEAAPLLNQIVDAGVMPAPTDLARCWGESLGIRASTRRAARVEELAPIAAEFLQDLCRALRG